MHYSTIIHTGKTHYKKDKQKFIKGYGVLVCCHYILGLEIMCVDCWVVGSCFTMKAKLQRYMEKPIKYYNLFLFHVRPSFILLHVCEAIRWLQQLLTISLIK